MAFILKSSKLIYNFVGFARQKALTSRKSSFLFLEVPRSTSISRLTLRTTASLATEENFSPIDQELFNLSKNIFSHNIHERQVKNVFNLIKETGEISYPQLVLLLRCCTEVLFMCPQNDRIKLAEEIWRYAQESGVKFDIRLYDTLLNVYLSNHHEFSPLEFLSIIEKKGLEPSHYTYKKLLRAYSLKGDIEGASTILDTIKQLNIPLTVEDFNALILCHCEMGDMEKALKILEIMKEKDIEPNSRSYTYLLCGYAKQGNIKKIEEYIKELENQKLFLRDTAYLDIFYTLTVNNHEDKINEIFKYISKNIVYSKYIMRIIQKLLHQKKDEAVFKILGLLDENEEPLEIKSYLMKNILLHFSVYRKPFELLKVCTIMESRGWSSNALSHSLRQVFLDADEDYCLELLKAMKNQGIPVRVHYYWPVLIKASKKGNDKMLDIIKIMPKQMLQNCFDTCSNIIFPNYKFGENWHHDYETLKELKLNPTFLRLCFLEKFISERKIDEAEKLISSLTIPAFRIYGVLSHLTFHLKTTNYDAKAFVNLLYYLAHDVYLQFSWDDELEKNFKQDFFNVVLSKLLHNLKDEKVFIDILKEMVQKKMGITLELVFKITSTFESEEVRNLANKLASLNFEVDNSIIKKKTESYLDGFEKYRLGDLTSNTTSLSVDELWEEVESKETFDHCIYILRKLVYQKKFKEALKIAENLSNRREFIPESGADRMYFSFIFDLCHQNEIEMAEQAFDLGIYMGVLNKNDIIKFTRKILKGGSEVAVAKVVDRYCQYVSESGNLTGAGEFLRLVVARAHEEGIKKLTHLISTHFSEEFCNFYLIVAYVAKGDLKKASQILHFKSNAFTERNFYRHCHLTFDDLSVQVLKNYLEFVKELDSFDRTLIYQCLLKKYSDDNKFDDIVNLWSEIKNDNNVSFTFIKKMEELMVQPTLENLKKFADTLLPDKKMTDYKTTKQWLESNKEISESMAAADKLKKPKGSGETLQKLISEGEVDEVIKYIEQSSISLPSAAYSFVRAKKIKEYLEFLNHYIKSERFKEVANCFTPLCDTWDDELFNKFKSLSFKCFEKGNVENPLIGFFLVCLLVPKKRIKEAEEIIDNYHDTIKVLTFHGIKAKKWNVLGVISENILNSEKLKSFYSKDLHLIYDSCIKNKCKLNEIDSALQYLNKAVEDGVADRIKANTIHIINKKLQDEKKSFPYPELLKYDTNRNSVNQTSN